MIIPTVRNSEELAITLDGLANQTYDDMEVVVVGPRDDKGRVETVSYTHLTLPTNREV